VAEGEPKTAVAGCAGAGCAATCGAGAAPGAKSPAVKGVPDFLINALITSLDTPISARKINSSAVGLNACGDSLM
jgi:hypothetical protein